MYPPLPTRLRYWQKLKPSCDFRTKSWFCAPKVANASQAAAAVFVH